MSDLLSNHEIQGGVVHYYCSRLTKVLDAASVARQNPTILFVFNLMFGDWGGGATRSDTRQLRENLIVTTESEQSLESMRQLGFAAKLFPPVDLVPHGEGMGSQTRISSSGNNNGKIRVFGRRLPKAWEPLSTIDHLAPKLAFSPKYRKLNLLVQEKTAKSSRWLRSNQSRRVTKLKDWLDDDELDELLELSDLTLLPYNPKRFSHSSSGFFISSLTRGSIPIVFDGTWMAHELRKYSLDFAIAKEHSIEGYEEAVKWSIRILIDSELPSSFLGLRLKAQREYSPNNLKQFFLFIIDLKKRST